MPVLSPSVKSSRYFESGTENGSTPVEQLVRNSLKEINSDIKGMLKKSCKGTSMLEKCNHKRKFPSENLKKSRVSNPRCKVAARRRECNMNRKCYSFDNSKCSEMTKIEKEVDDSLTSLEWLTGINANAIMEGKQIQYGPLSPAPSNSSDDGDEKSKIELIGKHVTDGVASRDYRHNDDVKPPYSYAVLIIMAMKSKPNGIMTLSEIYKWISESFVFYRKAEQSWQNSIRHNLSLNKCFAKIPRKKGDPGKGGYWSMVPEYADRLLENNIRKRRSNTFDFNMNDIAKRRRLEMLEAQLLSTLRSEKDSDGGLENPISPTSRKDTPDEISPVSNQTPLPSFEEIVDTEKFRMMDHSYVKSPVVNYDISDVENIRAIATNLEDTLYNRSVPTIQGASSAPNSISHDIRSDCIWGKEISDSFSETMTNVTEQLLESQHFDDVETAFLNSLDDDHSLEDNRTNSYGLDNSLSTSNSYGLASSIFCLSPPLSGDDELSDDLEYIDEHTPNFSEDDFNNLMVRGTGMTLLKTNQDERVKDEPLSPDSIDLVG